MVGLGRFELPTSPLSGVRSNQLSYRPFFARSFSATLRCACLSLGRVLMYAPSLFAARRLDSRKNFFAKIDLLACLRKVISQKSLRKNPSNKEGICRELRGLVAIYEVRCGLPGNLCWALRSRISFLFKGGDPAAGSPTATLLRLHPSH